MLIDDFRRYSNVLHEMTVDFVRAVPEDKWNFTPDPPRALRPRRGASNESSRHSRQPND